MQKEMTNNDIMFRAYAKLSDRVAELEEENEALEDAHRKLVDENLCLEDEVYDLRQQLKDKDNFNKIAGMYLEAA